MKKLYLKLRENEFTYATMWMTVGGMFANAGAFFFIFILVRILQPADYADVVSLISAMNLLVVPAGILQLTIVGLVAEAKGKGEIGKVKYVFDYFLKRLIVLSVILMVALAIFSQQINQFLHISDSRLLFIIGFSAAGFFFLMLGRSVMQGMLYFESYTISTVAEMVFKVILALVLIALGFGVFGAVLSILLSEIIVTVLTLWIVGRRFTGAQEDIRVEFEDVVKLTLPSMFMLLGLTSFYASDILLVKHFFQTSGEAALYVGVATLGKIIFFGTAGVASALLPVATARHASGEKADRLFFAGLGMVALVGVFMTGVYYILPQYLFMLLGKAEYAQASNLLGPFGIFITCHALVFLTANFYLSIRKLYTAYIVFAGAIIQIVGILLFHQSLLQVIWVSTSVSALLLVLLLLLYFVPNLVRKRPSPSLPLS